MDKYEIYTHYYICVLALFNKYLFPCKIFNQFQNSIFEKGVGKKDREKNSIFSPCDYFEFKTLPHV